MSDLADRQLLFAVLAFQDDYLDLAQLSAACRGWAADKTRPIADLIQEKGWIMAEDRRELERRLERKLRRSDGNLYATLGKLAGAEVRQAIQQANDPDLRRSLGNLPPVTAQKPAETMVKPPPTAKPTDGGPRYSWIEVHAQGGLGRVWRARDNHLCREVALKEILPGNAADAATARRFVKEALITGQLQHPNIVPVYELARRSQDDQPYYTMRFVSGRTLTTAINDHHDSPSLSSSTSQSQVTLAELLRAFISICHAIHYAHSRGVIHRDLKPENVILGEFGEVQVLDWGLAKLVNQQEEIAHGIVVSDEAGLDRTFAGSKLGTPSYMAPEQAEGKLDELDARTDVYGLGTILFQILTGTPPHLGTTIGEVLEGIVSGETPQASERRKSGVPRELDAVCAKAMAKSRMARYQTADHLRQEVQRWLDAEGTAAAARKQTQLALDTLNSVVFEIQRGLTNVPGTLSIQRRILGTVAARLEQLATEFSQAGIKDRLAAVAMMETASVLLRLGETERELGASPTTTAKQLLEHAQDIIKQLADASPDNLYLQRDLDVSYSRLGSVMLQVGDLTAARRFFELSLGICQRLANAAFENKQSSLQYLSQSYGALGDVMLRIGDVSVSRACHAQSLRISQELADSAPQDAEIQRQLAFDYAKWGDATSKSGNLTDACDFYERSLKIRKQLADAFPQNVEGQLDLAFSYHNLGDVVLEMGNLAKAHEYYEQSLKIRKRLGDTSPNDTKVQHDLAISYQLLGTVKSEVGDVAAARGLYEQSLTIRKHLASISADDAVAQRNLSISYGLLGKVTSQLGDLAAARDFCEQSLRIDQRLAAASPDDTQAQRDLMVAYNRLGNVTLQLGDEIAACRFHQNAMEHYQRLVKAAPDDAEAQRDLAVTYDNLGCVTLQMNDVTTARGYFEQCQQILQTLAYATPDNAQAQRDLMGSYYKLGDLARTKTFDFEAAGAQYLRGMVILQAFSMRTGLNPFDAAIGDLKDLFGRCVTMSRGVLDLAYLENQPLDCRKVLLYTRVAALTYYSQLAAIALPAAVRERWSGEGWRLNLLEDAANTVTSMRGSGMCDGVTFYFAGCGLGLCLNALNRIAADPDIKAELDDEGRVAEVRDKWTSRALIFVANAAADGSRNADDIAEDPDLQSLRDFPPFQGLLRQIRAMKTSADTL